MSTNKPAKPPRTRSGCCGCRTAPISPCRPTSRRARRDWTSSPRSTCIAPCIWRPARALVPTGLALELPVGYEAQVRPCSGWALRSGMTVLNSPGTIDSDYRGEVQVILANLGGAAIEIRRGDRIAQLVVQPVVQAQLVEVAAVAATGRGPGGFGSTGAGAARPAAREKKPATGRSLPAERAAQPGNVRADAARLSVARTGRRQRSQRKVRQRRELFAPQGIASERRGVSASSRVQSAFGRDMRNNQTLFFILALVILVLIGLWALNAGGPDTTGTTTTKTTTPSVTERSTTGPATGEAGKTTPATPPATSCRNSAGREGAGEQVASASGPVRAALRVDSARSHWRGPGRSC